MKTSKGYSSPHLELSEAGTEEALHILTEECGEVVQAAMKCLRHGMESCHPEYRQTNREHLEKEVADVQVLIAYLIRTGVLDPERIREGRALKRESLKEYSRLPYAEEQLNKRRARVK